MIICRTLQEFLNSMKIKDIDIRKFNESLHNDGNNKIKNTVLNKFSSYSDEKKSKNNTALSYAKQKTDLWQFIRNQSYEAYSEEFDDNHIDSSCHAHRFFYRGVADKNYKLVSGIYRSKEKFDIILNN